MAEIFNHTPSHHQPRPEHPHSLAIGLYDIRTGPPHASQLGESVLLRTDRGDIQAMLHQAPEAQHGVIWVGGARGGFGRPGQGAYARLADVLWRDTISSLRLCYRSGMAAALSSPTISRIRGPSNSFSATRISSTRSNTPSWRRDGFRIFGGMRTKRTSIRGRAIRVQHPPRVRCARPPVLPGQGAACGGGGGLGISGAGLHGGDPTAGPGSQAFHASWQQP
jgi:hypothetical protein